MMPEAKKCPSCGNEIPGDLTTCPRCNFELEPHPIEHPIRPEMLVQRFGDYLIESKLITAADLEKALAYQHLESENRSILLGQALVELNILDHDTLDRAITSKLVGLQAALLQANKELEQRVNLLQTTQDTLKEVAALYQSSSQMARAGTMDEVVRIVIAALKQINYLAVFFVPEQKALRRLTVHEPEVGGAGKLFRPVHYSDRIPISVSELEKLNIYGEAYTVREVPEAGSTTDLPEVLITPLRKAGYKQMAIIPSRRRGRLEIMFVLAIRETIPFRQNTLQSLANLAEITAESLDKVYTAQRMEKRLMALQSLNAISQAVSVETDLMTLYQVIHREVVNVIGNVHFAIATYNAESDSIEIPYLFDGMEIRALERFSAGEGLTSILIRTGQPLMLVEESERKMRELGAKMIGKPAKSWLGVPLLIAGEAIGAIILQDLEHEGRFDEDDLRLLTTLASQVAVAIRNARMLESIYHQAARERRLYEITKKIRSESNIPGIMQTTVNELGKILGSKRAVIELGYSENGNDEEPEKAEDDAG